MKILITSEQQMVFHFDSTLVLKSKIYNLIYIQLFTSGVMIHKYTSIIIQVLHF